jgi:hypothetical protein
MCPEEKVSLHVIRCIRSKYTDPSKRYCALLRHIEETFRPYNAHVMRLRLRNSLTSNGTNICMSRSKLMFCACFYITRSRMRLSILKWFCLCCTSFMEEFCAPEKQNFPMMMSAGAADAPTIATFLITRPPIGFIGWSWESDDRKWPANDIFLTQPGVPKGLCVKEGGGKYSREWSNGKATLDCSTWTAGLPFPSL